MPNATFSLTLQCDLLAQPEINAALTIDERLRLCCLLQKRININLRLRRFDAAKRLLYVRRCLLYYIP